jgi:hypothetical protein
VLRLPVVSALGDIVSKPTTAMAELVSRITGTDVAIAEQYFFGAFGMLLVIAAVALWHRVSRAIWRAWEAQQARHLFARAAPVNQRWWIAAIGGVAAIPATAAMAILLWPEGTPVTITELRVYQLLGATIVGAYWALAIAAGVRFVMQVHSERSVSWSAVWPTVFIAGFAAAWTPRLFPSNVFDILTTALVVALAIGFMIQQLILLAEQAQRTVRPWRVVAALPVLLAMLYATVVLVWGLGTAIDTPAVAAMLGGASVYVLTLFALRGVLWLIARVRRAKSGTEAGASAVIGE